MYLLGFVVAVIFVLLVLYRSPDKLNSSTNTIFDGERKIVKYSGLEPSSYTDFVNNIQLMKTTYEPEYLYKALDNLEDLSLYTQQSSDLHIIEDIKSIIVSLGKDGEKYLLSGGHPFVPTYLNTLSS